MLSFSASLSELGNVTGFIAGALHELHADRKARSREIEYLLARFGDGARCGDDIPLAVFEGGKKLWPMREPLNVELEAGGFSVVAQDLVLDSSWLVACQVEKRR